jgi:hypothetical protein
VDDNEYDSIWRDELTPAIVAFTLGPLCLLAGYFAQGLQPPYFVFMLREYTTGGLLLLFAFGGYRIIGFNRVPAMMTAAAPIFFAMGYLISAHRAWVPFASLLLVAVGAAGLILGGVFLWRAFAEGDSDPDLATAPQL